MYSYSAKFPPEFFGSFQRADHPQSTQCTSPRDKSHCKTHQGIFLLAKDGERHHGGGSYLHGLSAGESTLPCNTRTGTHSCSTPPLLTCTCGFGGPATKVCRIHPPIHSHGSYHQVARSNSVVIHRCRRLCSRTLHRLDSTVWGALYNHQRQRATIYTSTVGIPLKASEHQPHPYNSLPSTIQWIG
jgi:hypothetical protein